MESLAEFVNQCLRLSLLGTLSVRGPSPSHSRELIAEQTAAAVPLNSSAGERNTMADLFCQDTRTTPLVRSSPG